MTRRTSVVLGLAVFVLVFGAAACGGDDDESPAAGEAMTETVSTEGTTTETTETEGTTETDGTTTSEDDGANTLEGETGPGFEIKLRRDSEDVGTLEAGTYTINVEDKSAMHNFHLIGPGVDEVVTEVDFVGERSVTVTLQPGTYTYQCDPHAANMNGTFTVT